MGKRVFWEQASSSSSFNNLHLSSLLSRVLNNKSLKQYKGQQKLNIQLSSVQPLSILIIFFLLFTLSSCKNTFCQANWRALLKVCLNCRWGPCPPLGPMLTSSEEIIKSCNKESKCFSFAKESTIQTAFRRLLLYGKIYLPKNVLFYTTVQSLGSVWFSVINLK